MLVLGISHKTAALSLRERFAIARKDFAFVLHELKNKLDNAEVIIISTCNRTEIYTNAETIEPIKDWFADYACLPKEKLQDLIYIYSGKQVVEHIMHVASGLDSLVVGEPQILGQIKDSYAIAKEARVLGKVLTRLFELSFFVAKQVRTGTDIGKNPVSIAYAAVKLADRVFDNLANSRVLLLGAGTTIELCARHLKENGVGQITFANRTSEKAKQLAGIFNAHTIPFSCIGDALINTDIVVCATSSQLPILGKGKIESALKYRRHKPIFMVDLSVPRNIEPEVGQLEDVYLYTIDDLASIVAENLQMRKEAARFAKPIIELQTTNFMNWLNSLETVCLIRKFRAQAEQIRNEAVLQALKALDNGNSASEIIERLGNNLTNQLIHNPTIALRNMGQANLTNDLEIASQILGIKIKE